jgi:hypothetical protein
LRAEVHEIRVERRRYDAIERDGRKGLTGEWAVVELRTRAGQAEADGVHRSGVHLQIREQRAAGRNDFGGRSSRQRNLLERRAAGLPGDPVQGVAGERRSETFSAATTPDVARPG